MLSKAQHSRQYKLVPPLLLSMREDAGLTQRELGKRLRTPQSWVHKCETAYRRVDVTEFIAWCNACDIDPHDGLTTVLSRSKL